MIVLGPRTPVSNTKKPFDSSGNLGVVVELNLGKLVEDIRVTLFPGDIAGPVKPCCRRATKSHSVSVKEMKFSFEAGEKVFGFLEVESCPLGVLTTWLHIRSRCILNIIQNGSRHPRSTSEKDTRVAKA